MGVFVFIGLIITLAVGGLYYTVFSDIMTKFPTNDSQTMQFLNFALDYIIVPFIVLLAVLWFINQMQKRRYVEVPG